MYIPEQACGKQSNRRNTDLELQHILKGVFFIGTTGRDTNVQAEMLSRDAGCVGTGRSRSVAQTLLRLFSSSF